MTVFDNVAIALKMVGCKGQKRDRGKSELRSGEGGDVPVPEPLRGHAVRRRAADGSALPEPLSKIPLSSLPMSRREIWTAATPSKS